MYVFLIPVIVSMFMQEVLPHFNAQVIDEQVQIGYGLAIGDVDGDRKPDILLADKKQFVWYRNGDWKRFVLAENLTEFDNVCIAARDITGDGKVEIAVGAQWNPSETTDSTKSGAVFYLIRPKDPTQKWAAVRLHHEPTVHRMKWVKARGNQYQLVVVPLHGRGNKNGEGLGVNVYAYAPISKNKLDDPQQQWAHERIDNTMHLTHNFDLVAAGDSESIYVGGKEGVKIFSFDGKKWTPSSTKSWFIEGNSFGEIRMSKPDGLFAGIEPMHGNELTVYEGSPNLNRTVLTNELNQGHALAVANLLNTGTSQVIVGWREPNAGKKTGIKIYWRDNMGSWKEFWIDDNGIACEDLVVADLDGDNHLDIIAAGRSSHNLKIYWNKSAGIRK